MSSICGILSCRDKKLSGQNIKRMTETLAHWYKKEDGKGTWMNKGERVALGHVMLFNTPQSLHETLPFYDSHSCLTITADARIDNREELCKKLDIAETERDIKWDSQLILNAYEKWGCECTGHLLGDFAFAIWDERKKRLFCGRDHLGNKPFFYYVGDGYFIFATEMKAIFTMMGSAPDLNRDWIADALTACVWDKEYTAYEDIFRLAPAHWMSISLGNQQLDIINECYWKPERTKELNFKSEKEYIEGFREKLTEAVRCRMRSVFPVGSELSGGLDSSPITALASQMADSQNIKFIAFSHVLGENDALPYKNFKDEKEFQEQLREYAGIKHFRNISAGERGIIDTMKDALQLQDGPTMQSFYMGSNVMYEAAQQEGIRTMLSGYGGDEGVSIGAMGYLDELIENREWSKLRQEYGLMRKKGEGYSLQSILVKTLGEYIPVVGTIHHNRRERRKKIKEHDSSFQIETFSLSPEFYLEAEIEERLAEYPKRGEARGIRDTQYWRIMHPHVPLRLEYCSIAAAAHGMEYRYPLLDVPLLEFHLGVPSHLKRKGGWGRYLFRKAIEGMVPPQIQWRNDKTGMTVPGSYQRFIRDISEIKDLIRRGAKTEGAHYLDWEKMLKRCDRITGKINDGIPKRRGAFLNALMLLLYFDQNRY